MVGKAGGGRRADRMRREPASELLSMSLRLTCTHRADAPRIRAVPTRDASAAANGRGKGRDKGRGKGRDKGRDKGPTRDATRDRQGARQGTDQGRVSRRRCRLA
jgi:hypothetical protein